MSLLNKIYLIGFLLVILLIIPQVSAQISLSPSTISISGFPGETIEKNITITTDGNYAVFLNVSNTSIILNYSSPLIVEKTKIIQVDFIIPKDSLPGNYSFEIFGKIDISVEERIVTLPGSGSPRSSGGMRIIYRNQTMKSNE